MLGGMDSKARRLVAIVDDDPGVLRALGRLVRSLGFDAATYASAEALLDGDASPDAVLLDLHLPGLRGPEAIHALHDRSARARIVVMTGLDHPGAREACLAAGAAAYLTKPVGREELAALLGAAEPGRRA
jgi:FixJ family two-component response regulator